METLKVNVNAALKYSFSKTLVEYGQAIANLTRQNNNGQFTERIAQLNSERIDAEIWVKANTKKSSPKVLDQSHEVAAIMAFNSDKRFSITE